MATVSIPITTPTTRSDGSSLDPSEIARMDVELSADNGQTFTNVGQAAPGQPTFDLSGLSPGSYLSRSTCTDNQDPPLTSAFSNVVSFVVPIPALAPPSPPVLGTPSVSATRGKKG